MQESYLIFELEKEYFALNIENLIEAIEIEELTPVPEMPDYIKGIMNFRGDILPVVDMNIKFNLQKDKDLSDSVILVLKFRLNNKDVKLGAIVDAVSDVLEIDFKDITALPEIGTKYNTNFIKGVIKYKDEFVVLPDIQKIFAADEITMLLDISEEKNK
jgi:purine-binding chemotaxis protein CheW